MTLFGPQIQRVVGIYIMVICYKLSNLVEVYHEEHFCEFRVCIKTA